MFLRIFAKIIRVGFLNLFTAFTTMFPFLVLMDNGGAGGKMSDTWLLTLKFVFEHVFFTPFEQASTTQMLAMFYFMLLLISLTTKGIFAIFKKRLAFRFIYVVLLMTFIYLLAWISTIWKGINDEAINMFMLTFYLFNIFSIFASLIVRRAEKGDESHLNLWKEVME